MKTALITGITGQDGSYLAEFLLEKGYTVYGMIRRTSLTNMSRIEHLLSSDRLKLVDGDMTDSSSLMNAVSISRPDEIYNLAAQSHVDMSYGVPEYSGEVDAMGVIRLLEAVRILGLAEKTRVFQASASDMFGKVKEAPQNENTPFAPYSPYAVAKLYGHWICKEYRAVNGMYISTGIMYNHESERRGEGFVTRKITSSAAKISRGLQDHLELGNMESLRDWGYAPDFVECMWLSLQQEQPDDYIMATGIQHSVRDFAKRSFGEVGIELVFEGQGVNEKAYDKKTGKLVISVNPDLYRPMDSENFVGDPSKARKRLGWNPWNTPYEKMISIMVKNDISLIDG